ncbi:stage II sporulation protein M [Agrococcus sp. Marseille-P2731]|uniref:stage II sporulation protein M n=1 Tax=Agrococcus sp. Marseille-P2731 TaxID=1841862 RepID=UPI0009307B5A|nr:stage II sporulation protein M [Agrococcus sp. Marseille-P2731]
MDAVDGGEKARTMRGSIALSAALVTGLLAGVACVAWLASGALTSLNVAAVAAGDVDIGPLVEDPSFLGIAARNLSVAGLLTAGIPLLGIPTLLSLPVSAMIVGFTGASVVASLGLPLTLDRVSAYIVFELAGIVMAATAGVLPTVHACRQVLGRPRARFAHGYTVAIPPALGVGLIGAALILLGAAIETAAISALT